MPATTTATVAVRVPAAVGVKVTVMVQVALAASVPKQVLVCVKSRGFEPEIVILLTVTIVDPFV
jgi:hypothetical protein